MDIERKRDNILKLPKSVVMRRKKGMKQTDSHSTFFDMIMRGPE